jgi:hypothetical protein
MWGSRSGYAVSEPDRLVARDLVDPLVVGEPQGVALRVLVGPSDTPYRRQVLKDETKSGVSPCVAVGNKTTPWPQRTAPWLPPGTGWWCHRFAADGKDWSSCDRFEIDCQRGSEAMASLEQKKLRGVRVLSTCQRIDQAWAFVAQGDGPYYVIRATETECAAEGGKDNCKPVP